MTVPARALHPERRRSRWTSRVRRASIIFLTACVVLGASGYLYVRHQLAKISHVDIPGLAGSTNGVMNVLLVGSDSRANVQGNLADATGKGAAGTAGQRSDTMMVLHIDSKQQKATILSIPRDLWVPIAGTADKNRINAAFAFGGPQLLVDTIKQSLDIQINHYVEVDFTGFERIVDTVGGVKVYVDAPARDEMTGLDIRSGGCTQLDGFQALAFVRSRYYQSFENGKWVSGSNSDIERIGRQQDFVRRMMRKAVSSGLTNPLTLNRLVNIGVDNLKVDRDMSATNIATVARKFRSLDSDSVDMLTLPTTDATIGGAAVQLLDTKKAQQYIDRVNGKVVDAGSVRPGEVAVQVLNGNGSGASASRGAAALQQAGFKVVGSGNADSYTYAQTVVRYGPGKEARAELLRNQLVAGAVVEADSSLTHVDVALVLGADYTGVRSAAPSPASGVAATTPGQAPPTSAVKGPKIPPC